MLIILFVIFITILLEKQRDLRQIIFLSICFVFTVMLIANIFVYCEFSRKLPSLESKNIVALFDIVPNENNKIIKYILPHKGEYNLAYGFEFQNTSQDIINYYIKEIQEKGWILEGYDEKYNMYIFKKDQYLGFYFYIESNIMNNTLTYGINIDLDNYLYYNDIKNNKDLEPDMLTQFSSIYK